MDPYTIIVILIFPACSVIGKSRFGMKQNKLKEIPLMDSMLANTEETVYTSI